MNPSVYFFNPEHDLALANSDYNYNIPYSARKLAEDLALLPGWYASENSIILAAHPNKAWHQEMSTLFQSFNKLSFVDSLSNSHFRDIIPWGWDKIVQKELIAKGVASDLSALPDSDELKKIRQLSHRRNAIAAHRYLFASLQSHTFVAEPAIELKALSEAERFSTRHGQVIFKAPWSGSGKGLSWLRGPMTDSHRGWCKRIIEKQGSVIGEQIYNSIQDFAKNRHTD